VAAVILSLTSGYAVVCTRLFLADRVAQNKTIESLQSASQLSPFDANHHYLLARAKTLALLDFESGIEEYKKAAALNPNSARIRLDMAAAYQMMGDTENQRRALDEAVRVDPNTPEVAWEAATFYVVQGDSEKAIPLYRAVLQAQPGEIKSVLNTLWILGDGKTTEILDKALPADPALYLEFLNLAVEKKDATAAAQIWERLFEKQMRFDVRSAFVYFQFLLQQQRADQALRAWKQATASEYHPTRENLMVNGDFENELLNGGLEWNFIKLPEVELKLDALEFHSGNRSLLASFDSGTRPTLGIAQYVAVEPGTSYRFSAFMKAVELTTASGPRVMISDASSGQELLLSDDITGTTGWKEFRGAFKTGRNTAVLKVEMVRGKGLIRGKVYMDDFVLSPE
jgi:Tfp pilus assembly protein PilF